MRLLMIFLTVLLLSGCSSVNLASTVAGGTNGTVNYCVRILGNEAICIEGKRTGDEEVTDESP